LTDVFELSDILDTFCIIVDTREQATPKAKERFAAFGVPVQRATLHYGDYCGNVRLPCGDWLYDIRQTVSPACALERKMSLDELAGCLGRSRQRFQREFERASGNKAKMYLLTENGSWEGILFHRYRSKLTTNSFLASLTAWTVRYDLTPLFCKSDVSGRMIKEILYRDMKERLQNGEYG
jgi:ERCC4-type nuclease